MRAFSCSPTEINVSAYNFYASMRQRIDGKHTRHDQILVLHVIAYVSNE